MLHDTNHRRDPDSHCLARRCARSSGMWTIRILAGCLALLGLPARAAEPERVWGTYVGGETYDHIPWVAVDETGSIYLTGRTGSTTGIATPGAHKSVIEADDVVLVKFDPSGQRLWGTYFGGPANETARSIAARGGKVVIGGSTGSKSGIATVGAFDQGPALDFGTEGFVACFSDAGALLWGTYVTGTSANDAVHGVALAAQGDAYVVGLITSAGKVASPGAHQPGFGGGPYDGYLLRLGDQGQRVWGTLYGGFTTDTAYTVAVGPDAEIYIAGQTTSTSNIATDLAHQTQHAGSSDAFIARFDPSGARVWGTYFGGPLAEVRAALAAHPDGGVVFSTESRSPGMATPGAHQTAIAGDYDVLAARFDGAGQRLWSTYLGGENLEYGFSAAVGADGSSYLAGQTLSTTGIATPDAWQTVLTASSNIHLFKFDGAGQRIWGTYYGAAGGQTQHGSVALLGNDVIVAGDTKAPTGMSTPGAHKTSMPPGDTDLVLARFKQSGNGGAACASPAECSSGLCVDGVCCDAACGNGDPGDCQACSVTAGAAIDGACGPRGPTVCRPSAGPCDAAESCDGVTLQCPVDAPAGDGTPCQDGLCESGICTPQGDDTSTTDDSTADDDSSTTAGESSDITGTSSTGDPTAADTTSGDISATVATTGTTAIGTDSHGGSGTGGDDTAASTGTTPDTPTGDPQPGLTGTTGAPESPQSSDAGCGCRSAAPSPTLAWLLLALPRRRTPSRSTASPSGGPRRLPIGRAPRASAAR